MNLLHCFWPRLGATADAAARRPVLNDAAGDDDPPCRGCGWFDSSHELQTGLRVTEHADDEIVAATLPVATWLELHLADWQADALAGVLCQ